MSNKSYYAMAEKVLCDLYSTVNKDESLVCFEIIPSVEVENKNSCPVVKGEATLGLESWVVPHVYPYAHYEVMDRTNHTTQKLDRILPCLLGVALLNPEMPAVWGLRRELIAAKKMSIDSELRIARMALSKRPKNNEVLIHRRWVLRQLLSEVGNKETLLRGELEVVDMICDRYHSNYHAWSHRIWCLQHLAPVHSAMKLNNLRQVVKPNQLSSLLFSESYNTYQAELLHNLNWISTHVSDNSGLHYRQFLLAQITIIISHHTNSNTDSNTSCVEHFVNSRWKHITDYLASFEVNPILKQTLNKYILNVNQTMNLFDIILSFFIEELKTNQSLSSLYTGHEALWSYRRYIVSSYMKHIQTLLEPQTNNLPKYQNCSEGDLKQYYESLYTLLKTRVISSEQKIVNCGLKSLDEHLQHLASTYSNYLKNALAFPIDFIQ